VNRPFAIGVLAILVFAALALLGYGAYQMGLAHGLATGQPAGSSPVIAYPYGPYGPFGFGFGFLGFLGTLIFVFLIFGLIRALFWRPRWDAGAVGHWEERRRRMFAEWHREAHGDSATREGGSTPTRL
jgi:hypothetical protein